MKFLAVMSGKGGVGKTTVAINLAAALNSFGRELILLDGNLSTPNIGLHLGSTKLPVSLHDVLLDKKKIHEAIYLHPSGLKVIPADLSLEKTDKLDFSKLKSKTEDLRKYCEIIIVDSAGGLNKESENVMKMSDEVLLVTQANMPSLVDTLKTRKRAEELGATVIGAVLNHHTGDETELPRDNIESFLGVPVIGVIPADYSVKESLKVRYPVVLSHPDSQAAIAFKKLAALLIGSKYEYSITEKSKKNQFSKILQKIGLKN